MARATKPADQVFPPLHRADTLSPSQLKEHVCATGKRISALCQTPRGDAQHQSYILPQPVASAICSFQNVRGEDAPHLVGALVNLRPQHVKEQAVEAPRLGSTLHARQGHVSGTCSRPGARQLTLVNDRMSTRGRMASRPRRESSCLMTPCSVGYPSDCRVSYRQAMQQEDRSTIATPYAHNQQAIC